MLLRSPSDQRPLADSSSRPPHGGALSLQQSPRSMRSPHAHSGARVTGRNGRILPRDSRSHHLASPVAFGPAGPQTSERVSPGDGRLVLEGTWGVRAVLGARHGSRPAALAPVPVGCESRPAGLLVARGVDGASDVSLETDTCSAAWPIVYTMRWVLRASARQCPR